MARCTSVKAFRAQHQADLEARKAREKRLEAREHRLRVIESLPPENQRDSVLFRRAAFDNNVDLALKHYRRLSRADALGALTDRDFKAIFLLLARTQTGKDHPDPQTLTAMRKIYTDIQHHFPSLLSPDDPFSEQLDITFIRIYARAQNTERLLEMIPEIRNRATLETYNTLLASLSKESLHHPIISLYTTDILQNPTIKPNKDTYTPVISAYAQTGNTDQAYTLFTEMIQTLQIPPDKYIMNQFIKALGRAKDFDRIQSALTLLSHHNILPNVYIYNTIISAFARVEGKETEALQIFADYRAASATQTSPDMKPTHVTYNILIGMFARAGELDAAERMWKEMNEEGFDADHHTFRALVQACVRAGESARAEEYFEAFESRAVGGKPEDDAFVFAELMRAYMEDRVKLLGTYDRLLKKGIVPIREVFRVLFKGLATLGDVKNIEKYYGEMREWGVDGDEKLYETVLAAYVKSKVGVAKVRRVYGDAVRSGRVSVGVGNLVLEAELSRVVTSGGGEGIATVVEEVYGEVFAKGGVQPDLGTLKVVLEGCVAGIGGTEKVVGGHHDADATKNDGGTHPLSVLESLAGKADDNVRRRKEDAEALEGVYEDVVKWGVKISEAVEVRVRAVLAVLRGEGGGGCHDGKGGW
ncbi:hypothetical protein HDV00_006953 [Rhizophlyctis rosea]|nr:hypothetical protein HDV00_006953 [Rhizophlyctis rosea]